MTAHSDGLHAVWRARPGMMLALVGMLAACRDERVVSPPVQKSTPAVAALSVVAAQRPPKYLPYGVPVPDAGTIDAEPEPYNPRRHGPILKDTRPGDNLAGKPGIELPRNKLRPGFRGMIATEAPDAPPAVAGSMDSWRGYSVLDGRGIYARFDLPDPPQVTAADPPSDWIAYTPTAMPNGWSCLEVTSVHVKDHNTRGLPYNDAFGIWDWCNQIKFVYSANATDYSFRDPYTRFYTDEQGQPRRAYWVQVFAHTPTAPLHSYDCWEADIYNFNQGRWEEKWTSCGVSQIAQYHNSPTGWVMHETFHLAATVNNRCYQQKSVAAGSLQAYLLNPSSGTSDWYELDVPSPFTGLPITSELTDGVQACWAGGTWSLVEFPYSWRAVTPVW